MSDFINFAIGDPFQLDMLLNDDDDDELLSQFDIDTIIRNCFPTDDEAQQQREHSTPADAKEEPTAKRFKSFDEDVLQTLENSHHSASTKRNTQWGVNVFQEWHKEVYGKELPFQDVSDSELATKLRKFYCEATPRQTDARKKVLPETHAAEYHRNTLSNIRSALNRHLKDLKRDTDIVRDKPFASANNTLDGFLKHRTSSGLSAPTKHREILSEGDLKRIAEYLQSYDKSPVVLRECAWYIIAIHFVTRGLEIHHQLRRDSLVFNVDDNGEYVTINHDLQQKTNQGGIGKNTKMNEKRVYATRSTLCPVKIMKFFLEKTDENATMLFNQYNEKAVNEPDAYPIWFTCKGLSKRSFANFMPNISQAAKLTSRYTAHCLRATAINMMNDAGFEARHIMFMSSHRNEASIRSYNRSCSNGQKRQMSTALSSLTEGKRVSSDVVPRSAPGATSTVASTPQLCEMDSENVTISSFQNNKQSISQAEFFRGAVLTNYTFNIAK